ADKYAHDALGLYQKNKDEVGVAKSYTVLGDIYLNNNLIEDALLYYQQAIDIQKKLGDDEALAYLYNSLGIAYYYQNAIKEALRNFETAQKMAKGRSVKEEVSALNSIGSCYRRLGRPDTAIVFFRQALAILNTGKDDKLLAKTYQNIGLLEYERGNYEEAVSAYQQAEALNQKLNDVRGRAIVLNNIGNVYYAWGKFQQAASYYQQALQIFENMGFANGIASAYTNLGSTFIKLRDFNTAREYLEKALSERLKLGNKREIANAYLNLANLYSQINNEQNTKTYGDNWEKEILKHKTSSQVIQQYKVGLDFTEKALEIAKQLDDKRLIASCLNNIGTIYSLAGIADKALNFYQQALKINREIDNQADVVVNLLAIGIIYSYNGNYTQAQQYFNQSLELARRLQKTETEKDIYYNLSVMFENMGNCTKALSYFKQYASLKDTLLNKETFRQIAELKTKYETEKKQREIELLNKDKKLKENQIRQQRMAIIFFIVLTLVISALIVLLVRQNEQRKRTNKALAEKNELITEQKKEITDSIQYASRIQKAVLPPQEVIRNYFSDYFILYLPRDIVSGDFYFVTSYGSKIVVAAADCTGHGVPGAFMSMLGMALLQEILGKMEHFKADNILNELRQLVVRSLHQSQGSYTTRDGMDMALYILDSNTHQLSFSGANNPLIIVRDQEIFELKADKMPIGVYEKMDQPFTEKTFEVKMGDMLYTFSDGYQDQFGGPEGKKFMSKRFKELLLSISSLSCKDQHEKLEQAFLEWKGDGPQIDDVLVVGVRV
ncbi:MAG: tetratricopeptide repeat protein, partial [Bacteroidales bacterium]|nr:tetratricopeptide repeat protein [Bacteroidales bacterium]